MLDRFHYLHYGLAAILGFVGIKMLLMDIWPIPIGVSLGVVMGIAVCSIGVSLLTPAQTGRPVSEPQCS
jgi:tellurite resistance protein TerC